MAIQGLGDWVNGVPRSIQEGRSPIVTVGGVAQWGGELDVGLKGSGLDWTMAENVEPATAKRIINSLISLSAGRSSLYSRVALRLAHTTQ